MDAPSVQRAIYEEDFARLIQLLTIKPEAMDLMTELAIQADQSQFREDVDIEKQKEKAIAKCRRRIEAAINLYKDGDMDRAEYLRIRETNEREIIHWQRRTTETERLAVELAMCLEAVDKLSRLWEISEPEDQQGLAQSLFDYIVYDLDTQQITDFRLKAWADRFLMLRATLYEEELKDDSNEGGEIENPPSQERVIICPQGDTLPLLVLCRPISMFPTSDIQVGQSAISASGASGRLSSVRWG